MGAGRRWTRTELLAAYARGEREFRRAEVVYVDLRNSNLQGANFEGANLRGAHLRGANFSEANLADANLRDADLAFTTCRMTRFQTAELSYADLGGADLRGATLRDASLRGTDLRGTDLRGTDLAGADLQRALLDGADLDDARLHGAVLGATVLTRLDLSPFASADPPVVHRGPCRVDHETVLSSLSCPNLADFLVRLGTPELFVTYMIDCARSVGSDVFSMMQSTFLSYGGPDEPFVRTLYEFLHRNGVTTFFFAEHAKAGEKLHRMMRDGVNAHDRVILVCSKASLDRKGVLNEVEETLQRESRDGGASYLVPIRLDDYVFSDDWKPANAGTAQAIRDRVVADFRDAQEDEAKFQAAGLRLLEALKKR